jgi:purine-nucleoside/S-methyl-5'-thioadenosine phosphorylase / adenosine deaminase
MRTSARPENTLEKKLHALDADFSVAGLVRNPRGKARMAQRSRKASPAAAQELSRPVAPPKAARNGVPLLRISAWDLPWLWSGFSTRKGGLSRTYAAEGSEGELNLSFTAGDEREIVLRNRQRLAEAVSGDADTPLLTLRQFHSNLVIRATAADAARQRPLKADGAITRDPGLLLAIQVADCIPVLVVDRKRRVAGVFHAGWRGTVKRIVEAGVGRMRLEFGSRPQDLMAAIGPGIGPCCYAVGEEVISEFTSQFVYAAELFHEVFDSDPIKTRYPMLFLTQRAPGHSPIGPQTHLDLVEANRRQLLDAGLKLRAIQVVGGCTNCHRELFFSHRGSRGHAGRMMGVVGVKAVV